MSFGIGCLAIGSFIYVRYVANVVQKLSFELPRNIWMDFVFQALSVVFAFVVASVVGVVIQRSASTVISRSAKRKVEIERDVFTALPIKRWRLIFNPNARPGTGFKVISFNDDGTIGVGRNKNEHSWRVRGAFLEILNEENKIFSRFKYDEKTGQFLHTNDEDTLSLRSQRIEPLADEPTAE